MMVSSQFEAVWRNPDCWAIKMLEWVKSRRFCSGAATTPSISWAWQEAFQSACGLCRALMQAGILDRFCTLTSEHRHLLMQKKKDIHIAGLWQRVQWNQYIMQAWGTCASLDVVGLEPPSSLPVVQLRLGVEQHLKSHRFPIPAIIEHLITYHQCQTDLVY